VPQRARARGRKARGRDARAEVVGQLGVAADTADGEALPGDVEPLVLDVLGPGHVRPEPLLERKLLLAGRVGRVPRERPPELEEAGVVLRQGRVDGHRLAPVRRRALEAGLAVGLVVSTHRGHVARPVAGLVRADGGRCLGRARAVGRRRGLRAVGIGGGRRGDRRDFLAEAEVDRHTTRRREEGRGGSEWVASGRQAEAVSTCRLSLEEEVKEGCR